MNVSFYRGSRVLLLFILLAGMLFPQSGARAQTTQDGFVQHDAARLTLNGQPFRFAGPNIYWLGLDENVGGVDYPTLFRIDNALDTVVAMGGTVVRAHTLGVSVGCSRCLMPERGQWNNDAWRTIDYAVYAAGKRGLKLIIPLIDEYTYYHGGRHTFAAWQNKDDGAFWTDPDVIKDFMAYAGGIVMHTNPFTGLRFRDDPSILAWETGNELNAPAAWTATFARYLKRLDSHHLVIDGNYGLNPNSLTIPEIDMVSNHFYPMNADQVRQDAARAQAAGKAFLVGEYSWKDGDLGAFLTAIEQSGTAGDTFWSLFGHDDQGNAVQHQDGYTLHYPGDTGAMQRVVQQLRQHAYTMRGQPLPNDVLPTVLTRPNVPNAAWPALVWHGMDPAPPPWLPDGALGGAVPLPQTPAGTFVAGVNLSGGAVTINGARWLGMDEAQARGMQLVGAVTDHKNLTPTPKADRDTSSMLNSLVYAPKGDLGVRLPLNNGTYQVYVWTMENYQSNVRSWNLHLEGQTAARDLGLLPLNTWTNYGPYSVIVQDGVLNLDLERASGGPMLSGFAVYQTGGTVPISTSTPTATPAPTTTLPTPPPTTSLPTTQPTSQPTGAPTVPPATLGNLLQNGDFEAGTPSGWETQGSVSVNRADAQRGTFGLALDERGRIDQRFATTPGQAYYVAASVRIAKQSQAPSWGGLRVQIVDSAWQELVARPPLTLANAPQGQWVRVDIHFVARSTESRLIFQNFSNGQFRASADTFFVSTRTIPADGDGSAPTTAPTPPTPASSNGSVRVEGRTHGVAPDDVWLSPWIRLTNTSTTPLPLSEITIRYWLINDGGAGQSYVCDYVPVGCTRGTFVAVMPARPGADTYLELSWSGNRGVLQPGQSTGEMQSHVNHQNWTPYHEQAHYSYVASDSWSVTNRITVYRNGTLIAGEEPSGITH